MSRPDEIVLDRLPEDVDAERSLLATLCGPGMEARAAKVAHGLSELDFVAPQHKALFGALRSLVTTGVEVNALTLKDRLSIDGQLNGVGGFTGLSELLSGAEVGRPEVLADLLRRKTALRALVKEGARLLREACEEQTSPEELGRGSSARIMQACGSAKGASAPRPAWEAAQEAVLADRSSKATVELPFDLLDKLVGGLHPGNLFVLAARPGLGKTSLALQFALHAARGGRRTAYFSLEMSQEELVDRLGAISGHLRPRWTLRPLSDGETVEAMGFRDFLKGLPLDLCDDAGASPSTIRAALASAAVRMDPYELVVVDYLQLMGDDDPDRARRQNEAVRVGAISRALKVAAKDFKVPIVVLSQLSRDIEKGHDRPPRLSDLRDSGAIEQDADQVAFIHRKWLEGAPELNGKVIVSKNRHQPTGQVAVVFRPSRVDFAPLTLETAPPDQAQPDLGMDPWAQ